MITPRRTRLVRVADLHAFRQAIAELFSLDHGLVVVPTRSAADQLRSSLTGPANRLGQGYGGPPKLQAQAEAGHYRDARVAMRDDRGPRAVTRDELYDHLHSRLPAPPRRLTIYERDVIAQAAARAASKPARGIRPGLVAEMLRFYDQLRRQGQSVARFEALLEEMLGKDAEYDRGAMRMLDQTRLLVATFRGYEQLVARSDACDEHTLRARLLTESTGDPIPRIVVTVGDWIADPHGLYLADFDLLTRLPGLQNVDVIATEALLASGFHQRIHQWLPGIEEIDAADVNASRAIAQPALAIPGVKKGSYPFSADAQMEKGYDPFLTTDRSVFVYRDREEELIAIARRIKARDAGDPSLDRVAVVFKRPLPYLYLAREIFGGAGIPYHAGGTLPLAAEPFAAAVDLVIDCVESGFTRQSLVALLRSPHLRFEQEGTPVTGDEISALDRMLSDSRYLGGLDRLIELPGSRALRAARGAANELAPLLTPAPASRQLRSLVAFVEAHARPIEDGGPLAARLRRARTAVTDALESLAAAHAAHDDPPVTLVELAGVIRRWIEEQTFVPESDVDGVQLLDDQAARYGSFDDIAIVGLIEGEWPERPRRNIFYPPSVLASLGWPPEKDCRGAAEAHFVDLLRSPSRCVTVSSITLDDEALVELSTLAEEIPRARLSSAPLEALPGSPVSAEEVLAGEPLDLSLLGATARAWAEMRRLRSARDAGEFHGFVSGTGLRTMRGDRSPTWSVSALETYLACPFKFFAQHVLRLEEEPEDEEVMDPRTQGEFVHEVFEAFFKRWQAENRGAVTPENLDAARRLFADVVEERLADLSDTEAALERTRLLGSPASAGLGEAVLRMEAERSVPVVGRFLEHRLEGDFVFQTADGSRSVPLKGKADRVDLLADGTFRLIDYKLGWPPNKARALQLPIYGLCAEQRLGGHLGKQWTLSEAAYLAFKGPKRVVPLFTSPEDRDAVLADAQARLIDAVDAISRGEFPPRPDDVYRCETCSYSAVCRRDYVGDV